MQSVLQRKLKQTKPFSSQQEEVLILLQMAAHRLGEPLHRTMRAVGLTPNQYNVLRILRGAGAEGLPCGEIGCRMITRDPDVTRLTDRLVRRGFATRTTVAGDRRVVRVAITLEGLSVLESLDRTVEKMPLDMLAPLGAVELAQLRAVLETLIENLDGESSVISRQSSARQS